MTLAVLTRAWGRRGEVAAISLTGGPERFEALERVSLFDPDGGGPRPAEIESVWPQRGQLIFKFRGVDTISGAESLAGCEVRVPMEQRAELSGDEFYHSDLVGCEVFERGEKLGVVRAVQEYGGPALLELDTGLLVPFARAICVEIDVQARRISVELPEGLKEL